MKCIQVEKPGGPEELQVTSCPMPTYGPNDVLVAIKAAGVNFIDIYIRNGLYKPSYYPYIPGKEGSGIVSKIGDQVKDIKPGDRVAFCASKTGSYAEYAVVSQDQTVVIPTTLSFEMAAATMLQGLTAYYLSHLTFELNDKSYALIHAGAGGVGTLLIQMAKILQAQVITTVSTDEKAELAKTAGADHVIIYTRESFLQKTLDFTQGRGVAVVYDGVGKTTFDDSLKTLAIRGMLVSFGQASGPIPPFEVSRLSEKSLYLTRPMSAHYTRTKQELRSIASKVFAMLSDNKLRVTIGQVYPLAEAAKAHAALESRQTIGKAILFN
jgi:NADPH:quinone reductase